MVSKLRDVFFPVLEFRDQKWTFAKVKGPKVDFFLLNPYNNVSTPVLQF
jgi:hypothetical protein